MVTDDMECRQWEASGLSLITDQAELIPVNIPGVISKSDIIDLLARIGSEKFLDILDKLIFKADDILAAVSVCQNFGSAPSFSDI